MAYCRVKPSGATSPFVRVKSAVGPIDARAVEIKQVATKSGEKDMAGKGLSGGRLVLRSAQRRAAFMYLNIYSAAPRPRWKILLQCRQSMIMEVEVRMVRDVGRRS